MWTVMPSSTLTNSKQFFTTDSLQLLAQSLHGQVPVVKGKVWASEERGQGWTIECDSFDAFSSALKHMSDNVKFLAFDESYLDEDAIRLVEEDLYRFAEEDGVGRELVNKALSALRSHEGELFAVFAYAFLASGQVLLVRAQSELAPYVFHPERLLSSDALMSVRKLKTLVEN